LTGRVGDSRFKSGGPRGRREAYLDYCEYPPCARLRPYVDCYWSLSADQLHASRDRILPDGKLELVFHHAEPFRRLANGDHMIQQPGLLLAGPMRTALILEAPRRIRLIAVRFFPWGARAFTPAPIFELNGLHLDAAELWGPAAAQLAATLSDSVAPADAIAHLQSFLLQNLRERDLTLAMLGVRALESSGGLAAVRAVAARYNVSERHLERTMRDAVGLSPKEFARVVRLRRFVQLIQTKPRALADAAQTAGFYDQPHLNREFKALVGLSPREYLSELNPMNDLFL
jgi:AraC-like DNA-binding protein